MVGVVAAVAVVVVGRECSSSVEGGGVGGGICLVLYFLHCIVLITLSYDFIIL